MFFSAQDGPIVTVTINRPEALNTLTHELILTLTAEIDRWSGKENVRIIILTGNGDKAFVGGVDVRAMMDLDPDGAERFITDLHRCFLAIRRSEKLVIASVNGFALGGGLEMVAASDLRIASDRARFGMPEVRVGIPSVIEAAFLPRLIGLGRAAEMVYLGEMIDAQEALRIGLINQVVPHPELPEAALQMAERALRCGPAALVLQKKLIAQWMDLHLSDAAEAGIRAFRECYKTREPREGMRAFLEKRKPDYETEDRTGRHIACPNHNTRGGWQHGQKSRKSFTRSLFSSRNFIPTAFQPRPGDRQRSENHLPGPFRLQIGFSSGGGPLRRSLPEEQPQDPSGAERSR
jgi:enoyl-CoA hydratase/carnithine racemase